MTINRDVANLASRPNKISRKHVYPLIMNGDMRIAQRGTSATGLGTVISTPVFDRWVVGGNSDNAGRVTVSQSTDVPTGAGFKHSMKWDCTTADTSIGATEFLQLYQAMEGQDLALFNKGTADCTTFTVIFWAKGTAATYACELLDTENDRIVSKLFTITTSWQKFVLNFPADTSTSDDFTYDNAGRFAVMFQFHAGSNFTSGTINDSAFADRVDANRFPGLSSFFSSTDNEFYITGVQLELGTFVSGSEPEFQFVDQATQLMHCQRYAQMLVNGTNQSLGFGLYYNANYIFMQAHLKNAMRTAPSLELTTTAGSNNFAINTRGTTDEFDTIDGVAHGHSTGCALYVSGDNAAGTSGDCGDVRTNHADVKIVLSADI